MKFLDLLFRPTRILCIQFVKLSYNEHSSNGNNAAKIHPPPPVSLLEGLCFTQQEQDGLLSLFWLRSFKSCGKPVMKIQVFLPSAPTLPRVAHWTVCRLYWRICAGVKGLHPSTSSTKEDGSRPVSEHSLIID